MLTWWRIGVIVGIAFLAVVLVSYRFLNWLFAEITP